MSLRILQLCHKPPRPAVDGGCIAMDSLTTGLLLEGHHVKVLTLHTHKHPFDLDALSADYLESTRIEAVYADTELNLRDAASHIVTGESYHLSRFHVPEMDRAVERVLREEMFDVVLLESIFTSSYIPAIRRLSDAEVVLRAHNVEHLLWEEVTSNMPKGPKKWLLSLFQSKLRDEEIRLLGVVDAVAAITDRDANWFRETAARHFETKPVPVVSLPFGLDVENTPHNALNQAPARVLHLGAMDWTPNVQGVNWLRDEVWPLVRSAMPRVELDLAGRHMPEDWVSTPESGVRVLGEVVDAAATYDTPCVVVVPLHAGSGMRIKLAEALAAGRPVVTTSKGMEGMALVNEEHVLVANTADEVASALTRLLNDAAFAVELGARGRAWAMENLGHRARAKSLTNHLSQWVQA
jgi:glycosyltransferase involved in cell wall biosynthesis